MRTFLLVVSLWLATSPLQSKIVFYSFRDGNYEIYTMDSDGSNQTRLTFNEASDNWPAWSPEGQQIAFHSYRDHVENRDGGEKNSEIYVMNADGTDQRRLTHYPGLDGYPHWSPDGSQIAFDSTRAAKAGQIKSEIYIMDTDGDNVRQVTDVGFAQRPRWSPDGQWILFMTTEIFAIRPDGTDMWQVSNPREDTWMYLGGFSPDGKQVLYTEGVNIDPNTSFPVIVTLAEKAPPGGLHWKHVPVPRMPYVTDSFGADGKSILFSGAVDDVWNIYRFQLDEQKLIQLTDNPDYDTAPQEWEPSLSVSPRGLAPTRWGEIKTIK